LAKFVGPKPGLENMAVLSPVIIKVMIIKLALLLVNFSVCTN
jgi:hypothetical protein